MCTHKFYVKMQRVCGLSKESPDLFLFKNIVFIEVELIYNVVPVSPVQHSDSVIHIQTFFFHILFHYGLSQDIEYSSLCYTAGPCCLSILYIIVCIG